MYKIIRNVAIAKDIYLLEVEAERIVQNCLPGQFVIVMPYENSERIPLTITDYDRDKYILQMIYQVVGATTMELSYQKDFLFSVVGPLGNSSILLDKIEELRDKKVLFVGGGVGIAPIYPQAKYLHEHGIAVSIIYGVKSKSYAILESEIKEVCDHFYPMSDDGTYGEKGLVTDKFNMLNDDYAYCVAIGPLIMMKYVSLATKKKNLPTIVSMNPIMVDGTGMCGACRVLVDGSVKFACIDGPEFDGHLVDFDLAMKRMQIYKTEEGRKKLKLEEGDKHHGGCGNCGDEE